LLAVTPDAAATVVALPARAPELEPIQVVYPGGILRAVESPVSSEPRFWLYLVPRERLPAPP
jgi:hypothetical protein